MRDSITTVLNIFTPLSEYYQFTALSFFKDPGAETKPKIVEEFSMFHKSRQEINDSGINFSHLTVFIADTSNFI